ncbi:MAG: galactofuranose ABC transporter, permease protein YjfF [Tepidisphaeraceae bacterium]
MPLLATLLVCAILYTSASLAFKHFFSTDVFLGFFSDESFLGIAALGETFVILSGGIDLSVGSVVGCTGIVVAVLIEKYHIHPAVAIAMVLAATTIFGAVMGVLIHFLSLPPFLVTLGGLFAVRGAALLVSSESITIDHPIYDWLSSVAIPIGGGMTLPLTAVIFLVMVIVLVVISLQTPFGRNVYAIGGNETSALLMGLPVGSTKVAIYALAGFCSGLAGVVYTIYTSSGNALAGAGMELDAIAAVVVGGTLLSGGVGYVAGTPLGVITFGIIQTAITFQGQLSSWWTRIAIGGLLLGFLVIQRLIQLSRGRD